VQSRTDEYASLGPIWDFEEIPAEVWDRVIRHQLVTYCLIQDVEFGLFENGFTLWDKLVVKNAGPKLTMKHIEKLASIYLKIATTPFEPYRQYYLDSWGGEYPSDKYVDEMIHGGRHPFYGLYVHYGYSWGSCPCNGEVVATCDLEVGVGKEDERVLPKTKTYPIPLKNGIVFNYGLAKYFPCFFHFSIPMFDSRWPNHTPFPYNWIPKKGKYRDSDRTHNGAFISYRIPVSPEMKREDFTMYLALFALQQNCAGDDVSLNLLNYIKRCIRPITKKLVRTTAYQIDKKSRKNDRSAESDELESIANETLADIQRLFIGPSRGSSLKSLIYATARGKTATELRQRFETREYIEDQNADESEEGEEVPKKKSRSSSFFPQDLIYLQEVCEILNIRPRMAYYLVKRGELIPVQTRPFLFAKEIIMQLHQQRCIDRDRKVNERQKKDALIVYLCAKTGIGSEAARQRILRLRKKGKTEEEISNEFISQYKTVCSDDDSSNASPI
jgi:hypothetical protein